jgi:hypothetical protein
VGVPGTIASDLIERLPRAFTVLRGAYRVTFSNEA